MGIGLENRGPEERGKNKESASVSGWGEWMCAPITETKPGWWEVGETTECWGNMKLCWIRCVVTFQGKWLKDTDTEMELVIGILQLLFHANTGCSGTMTHKRDRDSVSQELTSNRVYVSEKMAKQWVYSEWEEKDLWKTLKKTGNKIICLSLTRSSAQKLVLCSKPSISFAFHSNLLIRTVNILSCTTSTFLVSVSHRPQVPWG